MTDSPEQKAASMIAPLADWLPAKISGGREIELHDAVEPSQGFSNTTILFRATWKEDGVDRERQLVARIQREATSPFLADIFHQSRVMEVVAANSDVAVPRIVASEADPSVLGAPFFLMDKLDGRVPSDFPTYHGGGWVMDELAVPERERLWWNGIKEMERLHRIDWSRYPALSRGATSAPGPGFYLEHFIGGWYAWAAQGRKFPVLDATLKYLLEHQPAFTHSGLVWNDARMGNTMFRNDSLEVAALMDFEVATLGPAEIDLGWWLYAEDIFSTLFGCDRLPGIPTRDEAIKGFEQVYGRPMPDFDYYEAVAILKHAVISIAPYGNGKRDEDESAGLTFATKRLSQYLERQKALG
jgi:aminoglycoside phosphotransferase (APT) family kinase protein